MAKTAFVIYEGIYCYTRISFRLNVGVDIQEEMNKSFKGLIRKIVEVYVDDIIVKHKKKESAPGDLKQVYDKIRETGKKLNLKKWTFGILSGKC